MVVIAHDTHRLRVLPGLAFKKQMLVGQAVDGRSKNAQDGVNTRAAM